MRQHFPEHFRPTVEDKKTIWAEGIVALDANILLNLYRVSKATSDALLAVFAQLQPRLYLPHQAAAEFYKHREQEISTQISTFEQVRRSLRGIPTRFKSEYARHPCIPLDEIVAALTACVTPCIERVTTTQKEHQLNFIENDDPYLAQLDTLLKSGVGAPYDATAEQSLAQRVDSRFQSNQAPCFIPQGGKGAPPPSSNPHQGDGRVWFQVVDYAATKKTLPVIFVTGDKKPNWWRSVKLGDSEKIVGPHYELIRDIFGATGKPLLMYSQEEFLADAYTYLNITGHERAVEELRLLSEEMDSEKAAEAAEFRPVPPADPSKSDVSIQLEPVDSTVAKGEASPQPEASQDKDADPNVKSGGEGVL